MNRVIWIAALFVHCTLHANGYLNHLPHDIYQEIANYCIPKDIKNLSEVSQNFNQIIHHLRKSLSIAISRKDLFPFEQPDGLQKWDSLISRLDTLSLNGYVFPESYYQYLTHLKKLILYVRSPQGNKSNLSYLTRLQSLKIYNGSTFDVASLSGLGNLREFAIHDTSQAINTLHYLTNLQVLCIQGCSNIKISDIAKLTLLTKLLLLEGKYNYNWEVMISNLLLPLGN